MSIDNLFLRMFLKDLPYISFNAKLPIQITKSCYFCRKSRSFELLIQVSYWIRFCSVWNFTERKHNYVIHMFATIFITETLLCIFGIKSNSTPKPAIDPRGTIGTKMKSVQTFVPITMFMMYLLQCWILLLYIP